MDEIVLEEEYSKFDDVKKWLWIGESTEVRSLGFSNIYTVDSKQKISLLNHFRLISWAVQNERAHKKTLFATVLEYNPDAAHSILFGNSRHRRKCNPSRKRRISFLRRFIVVNVLAISIRCYSRFRLWGVV